MKTSKTCRFGGPMVYIMNSRIISKPTSWFDLVNSHYFDLNSFSTPPENLELNLGNKTCICTAELREYEIIRGIVAPTACSKLYISCSVIQARPEMPRMLFDAYRMAAQCIHDHPCEERLRHGGLSTHRNLQNSMAKQQELWGKSFFGQIISSFLLWVAQIHPCPTRHIKP